MAASTSSSNSVSNPQPQSPVPKQEAKQEPKEELKQEPYQEFKQEPKQEPQQDVDVKDVKKEPMEDSADIMNNREEERVKRFQKYEADFKQYLMNKYFSDKTLYGGNIFDVKVNMDGQTTMASRLPPYQSFLDPGSFEEVSSKGSFTPKDQGPGTSKGKSSTSER